MDKIIKRGRGKPKRYEGEDSERISVLVRPRYKKMVEMFAKLRQSTLSEAMEYSIAKAAHSTNINNKSVYEWCVNDFEIYWLLFISLDSITKSDDLLGIAEFKKKKDIDSKLEELANFSEAVTNVLRSLYAKNECDVYQIDNDVTSVLAKELTSLSKPKEVTLRNQIREMIFEILYIFAINKKLTIKTNNDEETAVKLPRYKTIGIQELIQLSEARPAQLQPPSESYKLEFYYLLSDKFGQFTFRLYEKDLNNALEECWKADIPIIKVFDIFTKLYSLIISSDMKLMKFYSDDLILKELFPKLCEQLITTMPDIWHIKNQLKYNLLEVGLISESINLT